MIGKEKGALTGLYLKNFQMAERALDLGHKSRECFAAFLQRHFSEEIDGQTALAKMSKTKKI
jgi:hypothetical protein